MTGDKGKSDAIEWAASVVIAIMASFMAVGCNRATPASDSGAACVADSVGTLRLFSTIPTCATDDWTCRARCMAGDAKSCLGLASAAERDPLMIEEADRFYRRACLLGAANACTNYAAGLWANKHSARQLTCARRVFEKACAAKEPFACGMVGRVMLESTTPPTLAEGRAYLENACNKVGGFPCRVLAKHLESGKLGSYPPGLIRTLLSRACAGGDPDACGGPATASETFH